MKKFEAEVTVTRTHRVFLITESKSECEQLIRSNHAVDFREIKPPVIHIRKITELGDYHGKK